MTDEPKREVLTIGAQLGTVRALADQGASWTMRSTQEISEDKFIAMARLAKRATGVHCILVTDEEDAKNIVVPETPALPSGRTKAPRTQSQKLRFALETLAREYGHTDTEAFYNERMDADTRKVWNEIEDIRRERHYGEAL
jgi:hypothetical protein